ncbi:hypothetical protein [Lysobacter sp. FW306-1B-D06B]|uniref:hypothetical protein n=1 Tax=Lysobacter sp. FW306-1B-D06B TaxID=3140250 RepID=UPI00313FFB1E
MSKTLFALAIALVATPFAASANGSDDINYTFIQLDAVYEDSGSGEYPWGMALNGSYAFNDNVFGVASISRTKDSDVLDGAWENTNKSWSVGIGFTHDIGNVADWVTKLSYVEKTHRDEWFEVGADGNVESWYAKDSRSGVNVSAGVLGKVSDKLTANAYLGYEDYGSRHDGNFYADFGIGYAFNPTWSLQGSMKLNQSAATFAVGVRASF